MKKTHLLKGARAEKTAEEFLLTKGMKIISRNFRSRFGEIDIIGVDKGTLVFVEVRFRSHSNFGSAAETVNIHKQKKLIRTAQHFLSQHAEHSQKTMRFDVIGIDNSHAIEWIKGAFLS